ncbi:MAG: hypothetical protein A2622_10195 [Bdellovibrionales bacterium RIFCSPHIGHO2_01_FULL_40_29]|nr:MAG: hypothetical protein A2622_10195 [Bdellovibrionales bacterium RIFCSPHIGHO2_01_FULL_40_29]OFZ32385.1 MAG: hypothetical protein A3D17_12465 [Bdellovibrionales bacterium RIFCSPHIGHO2_02_FULL_40_15]
MKRYLSYFCLVLIACSTQPTAKTISIPGPIPLATDDMISESSLAPDPISSEPTGKLSNWACDVLIERAEDTNFSLNNLAALVAKKRCANFTFDVQKLSDVEKRIYAERIAEFDPTSAPTSLGSLSIDDLKLRLQLAKTPAEKYKAYKQLRAKQKNNGRRHDFIKTTTAMHIWARTNFKNKKNIENRIIYYEASQLYARTFWTEDKLSKAQTVLEEALTLLKDDSTVGEIYFLQARMAEEKLDMDHAVALYDLAAADIQTYKPKPLSFNMDRILWLKSWILLKEKKWPEAEKSFQLLAETTTDISEKSRANFFRSRTLSQQDKKEEARKILESITQDDFFGYYGLVAYHELGRKLPAISKIKFEKKFPFDLELGFLNPIEKNIFQDLIRFQELDLAERSVSILGKSPEDNINLGLYLAEHGLRYLPLFAAFGKLDNNGRIEVLVTYANLVYPQPHQDQVKIMSEKTSIPSSLIYSIMKQESAFNEKTRSPADALGLMQMIPRLAKQLSKKFDISYREPHDLYDPEINIQLGALELMEQIKKQSGQLTFVAAAYNAGPNALSGWLRTRNRADMLEFIEEIPYEETRTYVKLIARNKLFYERISKRDEEHLFPAEFLEWTDSKKNTAANN